MLKRAWVVVRLVVGGGGVGFRGRIHGIGKGGKETYGNDDEHVSRYRDGGDAIGAKGEDGEGEEELDEAEGEEGPRVVVAGGGGGGHDGGVWLFTCCGGSGVGFRGWATRHTL
jgi:hypothetical protein